MAAFYLVTPSATKTALGPVSTAVDRGQGVTTDLSVIDYSYAACIVTQNGVCHSTDLSV